MFRSPLRAASGVIRAFVAIVVMPVAALTALPAQAVPYSLCVTLADSSGHASGTHTLRCDPTSVTDTLVSTTFGDPVTSGSYQGAARASSDAFDTVRLFASVQLTDYLPGSYLPYPLNGGFAVDFAATASAFYTDLVSISGPPEPAVVQLSFGLTGTLFEMGASAQLCHGFEYGSPILSGVCEVGLPPLIIVESDPFIPDGTSRPLNFQFAAVVFTPDENQTEIYSASATADLENTIVMQELLVMTPLGEPIPGITLRSLGEFPYPLSPLNQTPAVPEPETVALMLPGLGLIGLVAGRRKRRPSGDRALRR
jgi:hypothetical protein